MPRMKQAQFSSQTQPSRESSEQQLVHECSQEATKVSTQSAMRLGERAWAVEPCFCVPSAVMCCIQGMSCGDTLATAHQHGNVAESSDDEDVEENITNEAGQTASPPAGIASAEAGASSAGSNQPVAKGRRQQRAISEAVNSKLAGAAEPTDAAAEVAPNEVASRHSRDWQ